jgi:hypothetical protein
MHIQPAVFQAPDKAVILSEALRGSIGITKGVYSAESKDLEGAHPPDEVRSFSTMMPEYRICISCPRPKGKTVAGPPDAASVAKSSERHG